MLNIWKSGLGLLIFLTCVYFSHGKTGGGLSDRMYGNYFFSTEISYHYMVICTVYKLKYGAKTLLYLLFS